MGHSGARHSVAEEADLDTSFRCGLSCWSPSINIREKITVMLNKAALVAKIATLSGTSHSTAAKVTDAFLAAVTSSLQSGEGVRLVGFGTFTLSACASRQRKNPRTGETITVPAKTALRFAPSKFLKSAVNP